MSNNRLIAKNTVVLYIRMGLTVIVSLFTARIVLQQLGVEDYGVYNVVCGVISMMSFLNASMGGATSRFITYEMKSGEPGRLEKTFGVAVLIHYYIAFAILIVGETVGLWFVNTQLVLPADSMFAANVIYQFTVVSACITIIQTPYNAAIISHEKFTVYAYVEIINVVGKLLAAYLLVIIASNRLIVYGFLNLCITIIVMLIYMIYCHRRFNEARAKPIWYKAIARPMLTFSSWDLFGNLSVTANFQGFGIAMNMVCGATINTAYGIANTVQGTLKGLAMNVVSASRPQIIKSYAAEEYDNMSRLMVNASNIGLMIYMMMAIPLYFNVHTVLDLWLGEVPLHADAFLRIVLVSGIFNLCNQVLNTAVHATGNIKRLSFYPGIVYLMAPFICFGLMRAGIPVDFAFCLIILIYFLNLCICLYIVKIQIPQISLRRFVNKCYVHTFPAIVLTGLVNNYLTLSNKYLTLGIDIVTAVILLSMFYLFFCLSAVQRRYLVRQAISKFKR